MINCDCGCCMDCWAAKVDRRDARIRDLEAENERLLEAVSGTAALLSEAQIALRDHKAAVAVLAAEANAHRYWFDGEFNGTGPMMEASSNITKARAATNSNPIASAALAASKEGRDGK